MARRVALVFAISLLFFSGCRKADDAWPETGKKRVLVSFPPLYCFTKNVAQDDVDVRCLLTAQGPHDFHWQANEVEMVKKADLVLINGLELDEWVKVIIDRVSRGKSKGSVFEVAEAIPEDQLKKMGADTAVKHEGHDHKHGEHDPHVWLGPPQAKEMVVAIARRLSTLDPANKTNYDARASKYTKDLDALLEQGKSALASKKNRNIVATHDSLQYFADAFGLKVVGNIQPRPGVEGDSKTIAGLVKLCKENDVRVIAVEPQYSRGPAEALKSQLGKMGVTVELVEIDPLETAPTADKNANPDPSFYMTRMKENIDNLVKALP